MTGVQDEFDPDSYAFRVLLAAVRRHDSGTRDDDDPAQCCMVTFQAEWLEAGCALVRIESRLMRLHASNAELLVALKDLLHQVESGSPEIVTGRSIAAIANAEDIARRCEHGARE